MGRKYLARSRTFQEWSLILTLLAIFLLVLIQPLPTKSVNLPYTSLPKPKLGSNTFEKVLTQIGRSYQWENRNLSLEKVSQVLWAAYGFSLYGSGRTVPSAHGAYPLAIFIADSDGLYRFLPESHSLHQIRSDDIRDQIHAQCYGPNKNSTENAPVLLTIFANREKLTERHFRYADAGCSI